MLKRQKKTLVFILTIGIIMSGLSLDFSAFASNVQQYDERDIIYITDENSLSREYFEIFEGEPVRKNQLKIDGKPIRGDYFDKLKKMDSTEKNKIINNYKDINDFILNDLEAKRHVSKDRDISRVEINEISSANISDIKNKSRNKRGFISRIFRENTPQYNIWIDDEVLQDKLVVSRVKALVEDNYKVVIKSNYFDIDKILEIFSVDSSFSIIDSLSDLETCDAYDMKEISPMHNVGVLLQKNNYNKLDIKYIRVKNNSDEVVEEALLGATRSTFIERSRQKEKSLIKQNSVNALEFNWIPVNSLTFYELYNHGYVQGSMQLHKNQHNPTYGGEHYFIMITNLDVTPQGIYGVKDTYITQFTRAGQGDSSNEILDYQPSPTTGSNLSLSLSSGGPSISLNTNGVRITKDNGGLGSHTLRLRYQGGVNLPGSLFIPEMRYGTQSYSHGVLAIQQDSEHGASLRQVMFYKVEFAGIFTWQKETANSYIYVNTGA